MTPEERKIFVDMQVERAHRFVKQADEMMDMDYSDMAVNRFYYACFHIVQALFIQREIVAHTHSGMLTQFSLHFVKTEMVSLEDGSFLARLFQLRQKADYNCAYDITKEEAMSLKEPTHVFIDKIEKLIY
ncbi:MAG: HEPN domain-containing protein [Bacteroidales bacterium]|nr:HEPN domain-containing protein [Bacteroidales bacterium]